jgi:glucose-6-phosphate 1-dehydrogenase
MNFNYQEAFGTPPPEAYTRLFLDVMRGDQTLFARKDWLCDSWKFLTPILETWKERKDSGLYFYPAGSWGPPEADALMARDHRTWMVL